MHEKNKVSWYSGYWCLRHGKNAFGRFGIVSWSCEHLYHVCSYWNAFFNWRILILDTIVEHVFKWEIHKSERDYDSRKEFRSGRDHRYHRDHRDSRDHRSRRDDNDYKDKYRHNRDSVDNDPIRQRHHPRSRNRSASPSGSEDGSPERPNYLRSGLLALETNRVSVMEAQGFRHKRICLTRSGYCLLKTQWFWSIMNHRIVLRKLQWSRDTFLYIFQIVNLSREDTAETLEKRDDASQTIRLDQLTYYLIGTDDRICHIPLDSVDKPQGSEKPGTQKETARRRSSARSYPIPRQVETWQVWWDSPQDFALSHWSGVSTRDLLEWRQDPASLICRIETQGLDWVWKNARSVYFH